MKKWKKVLAAFLVATLAMGELSQTTLGSYVGMKKVNAEEVSAVSGGAVSEKQEMEESDTVTVEETVAPEKKTVKKSAVAKMATNLPSSVDNSTGENGKYFPQIGNQWGVGACLHWAMEYYIQTYSINRYFDRKTTESNTFSPKWTMALGHRFVSIPVDRCPLINFSDNEDFLPDGTSTYADCEADWMEVQKYNFKANSLWNNRMGIDKPVDNGPDSKALVPIKEQLAEGNVLYLYTYFGWLDGNQGTIDGKLSKENKLYAGQKIYYVCQGSKDPGYHAMTIVGYNDNIGYDINGDGVLEKAEKGAFLVANQYGTEYGNNGFIWVSYDALNKVSNVTDKKTTSGFVEVPKGKNRVSFAATIDKNEYDYETIAKEELDYYVAVTLRAKDRNINMAVDSVNVEKEGSPYTIWASNLVKYNLAGNKQGEECEATVILACKDLSDGASHYLYVNNKYVKGEENPYPITIEKVKFVDNVHGVTYSAAEGSGKVEGGKVKRWNLNRNATLPHFKKIKLLETKTNVKVTAVAEDTAGDISYMLSYKSENGKDNGMCSQNKTGSFSFVPKTNGYYRVKITATDKNGKSSEKTKLIKIDSTFKITNFDWNLDNNCSTVSTKRTLTASTLYGKGTVQYKFAFIDAEGNHTIIQDYSTKATAQWSPSKEGTYNLIVYAKDNSGTVVDSVKSVTINPKMKLKSFTIDRPSPQTIDKTINATVEVTGGVGKKQCSIFAEFIKGDYYPETKVLDFKMYSDIAGTFTTHIAGTYRIYAVVKDEVGEIQIYNYGEYIMKMPKTMRISKFDWDSDLAETTVGKVRKLMGTVIDNNGTVDYKYAVKDSNGTVTDLCSYSTNNEVSWIPKKAGEYTLIMYAKDIDGKMVQSEKKVKVNEGMSLESVTFDKTSPQKIGTTINATAKIKGGTGNKKCRIHVRGGNYPFGSKELYFTMNSDVTGSWTPDADGTYKVYVTVTDDSGLATMLSSGNYVVSKGMVISSFNWDINLNETTVGKARSLTGAVENNNGTVNYKFAVKASSGIITDISNYSTSNKISWTPQKAGEYTLIMYAKDASGEVVQSEKKIKVNEGMSLESITFDKTSPQKIGTTINATAKIKGGTGNKKCRIHVRGGNYPFGSKELYFTMNSDVTGSWTPDTDGIYKVYVTVTDDSGYTMLYSGSDYLIDKGQQKSTTIYYSGYDTPYIHYMVEGGTWTTVPGVKMEASSEKEGYTHKIIISLGNADKVTVCFNNGNGSWDSRNGSNYILHAGTYGIKNQNIYDLEVQETPGPTEEIAIKNVTIDKGTTISYGEIVNITVEATGGDGNYKYSGMAKYDSHGCEYMSYTSGNTLTWKPKVSSDTYYLFITVEDGQGHTTETTIPVKVVDASVTKVYYNNAQWTTAYAHYRIGTGNWTTVPGVKMENSDKLGYRWMCVIPIGTEKEATVCFNNGANSWDSKNGSNYKIGVGSYGIKDGTIINLDGQVTSAPVTPTPPIVSPSPEKHKVVVYYANSNFNNAYIHYKVNGQWTQAPGVKMLVSDAQSGYKWRYEIDLGDTTSATVCFNNGNGSWDSRNGANYEIQEGVVGIKDGKQEILQEGMHWENFSADKQSPQKKGTSIILQALFSNAQEDKYNSYAFYVTKDGEKVQLKNTGDNTAVWTPTEEGKYILTAVFNYFTGEKFETTMIYEIKESNLAIVYYNNASWTEAYIHYKLNEKWTDVPGVKMQASDRTDYKWMYTIDLDIALQAEICFNNGNNVWDSQGGKNYTVVAGENKIN